MHIVERWFKIADSSLKMKDSYWPYTYSSLYPNSKDNIP